VARGARPGFSIGGFKDVKSLGENPKSLGGPGPEEGIKRNEGGGRNLQGKKGMPEGVEQNRVPTTEKVQSLENLGRRGVERGEEQGTEPGLTKKAKSLMGGQGGQTRHR